MSENTPDNQSEFVDQQRELSSAGGAKAARFYDEGGTPRSRQEKEQKDQAKSREFSRLMEMLENPIYAAARQEFGDFLSSVEQATEAAIAMALQACEQAQATLQATLDNANRLPDGRAVFRDPATGNVYTEDGTLVSPEEAEAIVWKDGAPTYQDYLEAQRQAEEARLRLEEIERYQREVLGPARDRFDDDDDPMTPDEFDKHRKRIETEMPPLVKQNLEAMQPNEPLSMKPDAKLEIPTL